MEWAVPNGNWDRQIMPPGDALRRYQLKGANFRRLHDLFQSGEATNCGGGVDFTKFTLDSVSRVFA